jgi:hypothetical protein
MPQIELFKEISISRFLDQREESIRNELRSRFNEILTKNPAALASEIARKYKLKVPEFDFKKTNNKVETYPERYFNRIVPIDHVIYEITFEGSNELLRCLPNHSNCRISYQLSVTVSINTIGFYINSQGSLANPGQPRDRVNYLANEILEYIKCCLDALKQDVEEWNENLESALLDGLTATQEREENETKRIRDIEDDLNPFNK